MQNLKILLEKHEAGIMAKGERRTLHRLLKEKYAFGDKMPEYRCPNCHKPLVYTWALGPACIWLNGGCGYRLK